ncbi:MAG: PIN domain-containing protein [Roseofilum sp. SBFL]|uniref:type II toxin-antitoxin system VapC family toxin n=1 Tax=unclassified Roseofilum TaxID=2620099 RepID=UPI001AFE6570|nr:MULTISPECIES: PIN domain-containing protein [unclassified Roseofilum]MBP0013736.1 PIN domain-containing protein [Roseofilum sp. SID3]MBP0024128.1 PIN domain-containing protein [Roseofilum sp. SID2]MBP0035510.1 PIN domain-containing protein [Roseofilum sp. Belize BBD 4]MBP0037524.1 PIN domain-containing protein [Roseofilum sp. SID1]MBP0042859.1 PIN domain-containing protein [Roseofilum sp. SBFL]
MKVLLDTNIILDYALERQPFFYDSEEIFTAIQNQQVTGYVSASTLSDLYYIIRKKKGKEWAIAFVTRLVHLCEVARCDRQTIDIALKANFNDFEDGIQYGAAIVNQLDTIITRNIQDFPVTDIQILTSDRLIEQISDRRS